MSAPGPEHEARVALLEACASLSGHTVTGRLSAADVPDVVRLDPRRSRLFVADAKDTESPGCAATSARLHSYARALRPWLAAGYAARFAVCHGRVDHDAGWTSLLEHAARCAALDASAGRADDLGPGLVLTWLDVRPTAADTPSTGAASVLHDVGGAR